MGVGPNSCSPPCIPQPHPNGWTADPAVYSSVKKAQDDEDSALAELFISIFPGLSRDAALGVSREGREALCQDRRLQ